MVNCWYCDKEIVKKKGRQQNRKFCSIECRQAYKEKFGNIWVSHGQESLISRKEKKERQKLLEQAKNGNGTAKLILRLKYGLTAIWNGKELVRL